MRIALFYHSLVSDWNHGNAHFLRGVAAELRYRGHDVKVFEPADGWSRTNLLAEHGEEAVDAFHRAFPELKSEMYRLGSVDLERLLDGIDLAIVHEWNDPELIAAIGEQRKRHSRMRLFFHDTHHRAVTASDEFRRFDLSNYDGILAYGASLKEIYRNNGWGRQVYIWHEAADTRVFYPRVALAEGGDLVWIGNWGDGERTEELREFLLEPSRDLGFNTEVFGVRYPASALEELSAAGIRYKGWLPNFNVPETFARFRVTIHVPRRPYAEKLRGIPTIRPFEALACGIPLVSAPWKDSEGLFRVGHDFLMAQNGKEMRDCIRAVLHDKALSEELRRNGLERIRSRHTCAHRVTELLNIYRSFAPAEPWIETPSLHQVPACG